MNRAAFLDRDGTLIVDAAAALDIELARSVMIATLPSKYPMFVSLFSLH